jgi:hypothetical protein
MKDEDIWLVRFGSGWIDWWELENEDSGEVIPIFDRMIEAGKLETSMESLKVRLKPNEPIRV